MIPRRLLIVLLLAALALPITIAVVLGAAGLLEGMGDASGAHVLRWVAKACGIVWAIDLIALVLAAGANAAASAPLPDGESGNERPDDRPQG